MKIDDDEKQTLMEVARALCGDVTPAEAFDFVKEAYRLGYLARKKESLRNSLTIELLKESANGRH